MLNNLALPLLEYLVGFGDSCQGPLYWDHPAKEFARHLLEEFAFRRYQRASTQARARLERSKEELDAMFPSTCQLVP